MPIKTIKDYLYRVRIHFIYQEPIDKAYAFVEKQGKFCSKEDFEKNFKKSSGFVFWAEEQDICLVLIDGKSFGTIAHEVFHVADNILRDKGLKLTESSSEAYAYYIGKLMSDLVEFLNESYIEKKTMKKKPELKMASKADLKKAMDKDKMDDKKMMKPMMKKKRK